jgi:hypothetical protein
MLKRYKFWLTAAVVLLLINAVLHTLSLFVSLPATNDAERQLTDLMNNYKFDMGAGFHPSFSNMFTALSSCFSFVCLLGGLTLGYLVLKDVEPRVMRDLIVIHLFVFGAIFIVMVVFTFIFPIAMTGLIFVSLLAAFLIAPKAGKLA